MANRGPLFFAREVHKSVIPRPPAGPGLQDLARPPGDTLDKTGGLLLNLWFESGPAWTPDRSAIPHPEE